MPYAKSARTESGSSMRMPAANSVGECGLSEVIRAVEYVEARTELDVDGNQTSVPLSPDIIRPATFHKIACELKGF